MSRMKTFAVIGCGVILAGVGLAFIRRIPKKTDTTLSRSPSALPSSPSPSSSPSTSSPEETRYIFWQPKGSESIQEDKLANAYFSCAEAEAEAPLFEDEEGLDLGAFIYIELHRVK